MYTMCKPSSQGQKSMLDPLELDLQLVVSDQAEARN